MRYAPVFVIALLSLFGGVSPVFAATLIKAQPIGSTVYSVNDGAANLGTGLSGTVGLVQTSFSVTGTAGVPEIRIICFNDAAYSSTCSGAPTFGEYHYDFYNLIGDGVQRFYSATSSAFNATYGELTFNPTKYYQFEGNIGGGTGQILYGSSTRSSAISYALYDTGSSPPAQSGINSVSSPVSQSVTPTAFPQLTFSYTNLGVYTKASAVITDITNHTNIPAVVDTISANGTFTYNETMNLYANGFYSVQPYIETASSSRLYGPLVFFSTVSQQQQNFESIATNTALFASLSAASSSALCTTTDPLTSSICQIVVFMFVPGPASVGDFFSLPNLLMGRWPFSYLSSFQDTVQTVVNGVGTSTTATTTVGNSSWSYHNGPASTTLVIFNPSASIADWPLITTMRDYGGYLIYFMFGGYLFLAVSRLF